MSTQVVRGKSRKRQIRARRLLLQKFLGLVLIAIGACIIAMASTGVTVAERDITPILLIMPIGLFLMFTKNVIIF